MKTLDPICSKVLSDLDQIRGRRVITVKTRTSPTLKAGHPFATPAGRATTKDHGLVKFSRWDMQIGDDGLYGFLVNCLWAVLGKEKQFVAQAAFYERVRRLDGTARPWSVAKPKGSEEEVLYLPGQAVKTHAHFYEHNGVLVDNGLVDGAWTPPEGPPKVQEIPDDVKTFVRWRAPKLSNIAEIENIGEEVTEGLCRDDFGRAVARFTKSKGYTAKEVSEMFGTSVEAVEALLAKYATA